jgi:hypothetical protein
MTENQTEVNYLCKLIHKINTCIKAHVHDTTSRIRLLSWRMKTIADATLQGTTLPVYQFMAKFEM